MTTLVNFPGSQRKGWEAELTLTAQGKFAPTVGNLIAIFRNDAEWSGRLAYNERSGQYVWRAAPPWHTSERDGWAPIELRDSDFPRVAEWLERSRFGIVVSPGSNALTGAIAVAAEYRRVDSVAQYLGSLVWDREPRLGGLLGTYFGAEAEPGDDKHEKYLAAIGARSLIAAVARTFEPGTKADHTLTLVGRQGAGKSSAIKTLAGVENFADGLPDLRSKDASDYLRGPWIVELSELDTLSRAELTTTKAFLSRTHDRFRSAFGRVTQAHPRRCVFIATTNEDTFLADSTGNRRFWPVTVGKIDLAALQRDRDQLWAEAVVRYRTGESWYLDNEDLVVAASHAQKEREVADVWQPTIAAYVAAFDRVSVQDVLRVCLGLRIEQCGQAEQNRVARTLCRLGWTRRQTRNTAGQRVWLYHAPERRP